jgi:hypothetical protein
MKLVRFFIICSMFFNCLAADASAGEIVALCRDTIAVPTSTFSVLFGCNLPLELITHLIEQQYPDAARSGRNHKQGKKQHQPFSDVCSLIPQQIEQRTCSNLSSTLSAALPVVQRYAGSQQYNYEHFDRWRPPGTACLILIWLVIVSLMNLPGDVPAFCLSGGIRGPSGNWRAFSIP